MPAKQNETRFLAFSLEFSQLREKWPPLFSKTGSFSDSAGLEGGELARPLCGRGNGQTPRGKATLAERRQVSDNLQPRSARDNADTVLNSRPIEPQADIVQELSIDGVDGPLRRQVAPDWRC